MVKEVFQKDAFQNKPKAKSQSERNLDAFQVEKPDTTSPFRRIGIKGGQSR